MSHRNRSPRPPDGERSTDGSLLGRRRALHAGAAAALAAVAGCLSEGDPAAGNGDSSEDDDSDPGGEDDSGTSDEDEGADPDGEDDDSEPDDESSGPLDAIDAYLEAAAAGDLDAIDDVSHGLNPFNPAQWEEEGWEFRGGDGEEVGEYDAEVEDGTIDDILELEGAEFWFAEVDLEAEIGDEEIALVELAAGEPEESAVWALVTEDGEWRVFFQSEVDDTPDDPTEAFDEEIADEDEDVVAEVDWEFEQEDQGDEHGFFDGVEWAQVVLTDDPGLEADRVVIESTIEGSEFEFYGEGPNSWTGSYANIAFNSDGDQIVVTVVQNGEETVVHREHYVP